MDGDTSLDLDERRTINQRLRLWVNSIRGIGVGDGCNGFRVLLLLFCVLPRVIEFDLTLQYWPVRAIIRGALLELLLGLLDFFLARRLDDTPAASPGDTSSKSNPHPFLNRRFRSFHDDTNVVKGFPLSSNQGPRIGFLEGRVLEDGQPYAGRPLNQGMMRIEVKQVSVPPSSADAENVLEGLFVA